jgi:UDP-3-O-[3-hydroxymyristoyl] glucosamine N-acyltransferase
MNEYTLKDVADRIGGEATGTLTLKLHGVRASEEAEAGDLAVVFDGKSPERLKTSRASAFVVPAELKIEAVNVIRVADPRAAFVTLLRWFYPEPPRRSGTDPRATVSRSARLGAEVFVGPGAVVGDGAVLGDRVTLHANVCVDERCVVGDDSELFPGVTLYPDTRIGRRVRLHAGVVIGADGFGYLREASGVQTKIPQVGTVEIGDDVEIGANTTVDRATLGTTRIREGTKIDNLVQIGHNCTVGKHCCLVAQVGVSGSVEIGNFCVLAGQVGIGDHVKLADGVIVGAQSGVMRDLGPGRWIGYPAMPAEQALQAYLLLTKLPELRQRMLRLEKRVEELASRSQGPSVAG